MSTKQYLVRFGSDNPANYTGISPTFTKFFNSAGVATTAPSISELASSGLYSFTYAPQGFIGFILDGTASLAATVRYVSGALDPNDMISDFGVTQLAMVSTLNSIVSTGVSTLAFGVSLVALGNSTLVVGITGLAQGIVNAATLNSLVSYGNSLLAQGNSGLAVGTSGYAIGLVNQQTLNSLISFGVSSLAQGVSLLSLGLTNLGYGTSNYALGVTFRSRMGSPTDSFGDSTTDPTTLFGYIMRMQEIHEGDSVYTKGTGVWAMSNRGSSTLLRSKTIADGATAVTKV